MRSHELRAGVGGGTGRAPDQGGTVLREETPVAEAQVAQMATLVVLVVAELVTLLAAAEVLAEAAVAAMALGSIPVLQSPPGAAFCVTVGILAAPGVGGFCSLPALACTCPANAGFCDHHDS